MKDFFSRLLRLTKVDEFVGKIVGYGLEQHTKRNPKIIVHLKKRYEQCTENELSASSFSKGFGVKISGAANIDYPKGLVLGNNVHIEALSYIDARGGVTIGDNTHIGQNVTICSSSPRYQGDALPFDNQQDDRPISIGKNVWININATIAPGVTIGDGAVIGMGAVINQNVPQLAIVQCSNNLSITSRNKDHYQQLEKTKCWAGANGNLLTESSKAKFYSSAADLGENMFFVLGTGRSGSTAIAKTLNRHADIICQHEPKLSLVSLSTRYSHGELNAEQVKHQLRTLYCEQNVFPNVIYGESDQKFSNIVTLLHEVLPKAKFIWLLRNPVDTINSTYSRGWFSQDDLYPTQMQNDNYSAQYKPLYSQYRLHADKAGVMDSQRWQSMSAFARNCWYWNYWNMLIEQQLALIPDDQKMTVKLEELQGSLDIIQDFLGVKNGLAIRAQQANQAGYTLSKQKDWNAQMQKEFNEFCTANFERWYAK